MKVLFTLAGLLSLLPHLLLAQPKFDLVGGGKFAFGDVYAGTIAEKILTIKNRGNDTLVISNVSASCGCTGTLMSNDRILPGDSGALKVTFNSKTFAGPIEKTISMTTNDTSQANVHIWFTVNVLRTVEAVPEYLYFHVGLDSVSKQVLTIRNPTTQVVSLTSITSTLDILSVKLGKRKLNPTEETTVECVLKPKTAGSFKGNVNITTDHPRTPNIDVRVLGLVSSKRPSEPEKK